MPTCAICKRKDDEPEEYGEFRKKSGICAHYYCLLLSSNLQQRGQDHAGILGFLLKDIRSEIYKCAKRTCIYCKKSNASIACYTCKSYYHQICGNENGCVSMFIDEFHSYCHSHVPFKGEQMLPRMPKDCWICKEAIGDFSPIKALRAYCCNNGYVHLRCMRRYALSAGYYLRCLWCGKKDFRDDVRKHGVFVPDREAKWDNNETVRFEDLHRGYSKCDASICLCPNGREYVRAKWKLKICVGCGASGMHEKCGGDKLSRASYTCAICTDVLNVRSTPVETRKHDDYTLFISKTIEDFDDLPERLSSVEVVSPKAQEGASTSSGTQIKALGGQAPKTKFVREMYQFGNGCDIVGAVKVRVDEAHKSSTKLTCQAKDIVAVSNASGLIKDIFKDIQNEGRELTTDMVDEVVERMRQHFEAFGDLVE